MKKLIGTFAAFAFAVTASAQSTADLEAQIQALMAQIAALTGGSTTTTVVAPSSCNFTQTLTLGSTGAEVVELQSFLEAQGTLTIPAGVSKGYFGGLTQSALAAYQAMEGISPAVGYFGPVTRANVNAKCGSTVVVTPGTGTTIPTTVSGDEASLEDFDAQKEDSDVAEGDTAEVATFEFDVEDGDVRVERLDLTFLFAGNPAGEDEPWDAFEEITLWADGDEIASEDVSDEDDWLDEDSPFVFRFTGLDYMVEEGDMASITVMVEAAGSVDSAENNGHNDWTIYVDTDDIRALDGAGIDQYIGDAAETVTFGIEEEGGDEDIQLKASSSDPDASTLFVETNDESEWHEVFVFKVEAEENDIDLDDLVLTVTTDTEDYDEVVSDVKIEIDGDEFDDFDVADGNTTTADLTFDIDKDFTIDGDDTVEVVVMMEFLSSDNYTDGTTTVQVSTVSISGEGVDDVSDTATITGEEHTLSSAVAELSDVSSNVSVDDPNDSGVISFEFTVEATEDDVTFDVADNADVDGGTDEVEFTLTGTDTGIATAGLTLVSDSNDASYAGGTWTIVEGETATFVLDVTFTTVDAGDDGVYRVRLDTVAGTSVDKTSTGLNLSK